jgi:hypothetical protein
MKYMLKKVLDLLENHEIRAHDKRNETLVRKFDEMQKSRSCLL